MPVAIVSSKGQITLPANLRRQAGIRPHDRVVIEGSADGLVVKRAPDFFELRGYLGRAKAARTEKTMSVRAVAAHTRGRR